LAAFRTCWFLVVVGGPVCLGGWLRADVTGIVTLQGKPNSADVTFIADAKGCGESPLRHTENWKVGPKGELADVVIWVVDPRFGPHPPTAPEPEMQQLGCRYEPHVLAVVAGAPFKILNGDPTLHNVLAKGYTSPTDPPGDTIFNLGQSYRGQIDERQFDAPGIYTLQCNVHSWMEAWVRALPTGCFAVTGADGTFRVQLSGQLLDGDYKIDAWHPRFAAPLEQTLHVKNGTAQAAFQFDGTKSL
jgi:plastocyanin